MSEKLNKIVDKISIKLLINKRIIKLIIAMLTHCNADAD